MSKHWVISFQDGSSPTYALVDELPIVVEVDDDELAAIDNGTFEWPDDCALLRQAHIHLLQLIAGDEA